LQDYEARVNIAEIAYQLSTGWDAQKKKAFDRLATDKNGLLNYRPVTQP
jgi:hypothetical protein